MIAAGVATERRAGVESYNVPFSFGERLYPSAVIRLQVPMLLCPYAFL